MKKSRKTGVLTLAVLGLSLWATAAQGGYVSFVPPSPDVYDLEHYYAYAWGINWNLPENCEVTAARITISNLYNWTIEPNVLYVNLLDTNFTGINTYWDNQNPSNYFSAVGHLLFQWSDTDGPNTLDNLVYNFTPADLSVLATYMANGLFGIGFDPDCHFYNSGVKLEIWYDECTVPEPGTLALIGLGGFGAWMRNRKKRTA